MDSLDLEKQIYDSIKKAGSVGKCANFQLIFEHLEQKRI